MAYSVPTTQIRPRFTAQEKRQHRDERDKFLRDLGRAEYGAKARKLTEVLATMVANGVDCRSAAISSEQYRKIKREQGLTGR
jgi:hypothetical protein